MKVGWLVRRLFYVGGFLVLASWIWMFLGNVSDNVKSGVEPVHKGKRDVGVPQGSPNCPKPATCPSCPLCPQCGPIGQPEPKLTTNQTNSTGFPFGSLDNLPHLDVDFMENRMRHLQPRWESAKPPGITARPTPKKIQIHLGISFLAGSTGRPGTPLSELVQWTDLITALQLLGHSLEFIESKDELNASLSQDFDLIYTDYNTVGFIREQVADGEKWFRTNKCKLRILDCFGTEPEFNDHKLTQPKPYCCLGINLRQFYTLWPYAPHNSFLGYVVEETIPIGTLVPKKNQNLLYGKDVLRTFDHGYIDKGGLTNFVSTFSRKFLLYSTIPGLSPETAKEYGLNNRGQLSYHGLQELLTESKLFIGSGYPMDGIAPLEALARGAIFINPLYQKPITHESKPYTRLYMSQSMYLERLGHPYVYNVDLTEEGSLRLLQKLMEPGREFRAYIPPPFRIENFISRVNSLVEEQSFC